jgi:hypothetical protein
VALPASSSFPSCSPCSPIPSPWPPPNPPASRGYEPGAGLTEPIQGFQSGVVNDYVTWTVLGLAALGGVLAVVIR